MPRILVIDDEELVRQTMRMKLEQAGYEVIEAPNGAAGLGVLDDSAVDLVVTDIIMPEKEGIETILAIRRRRPGVPIIAISGGGRTRDYDFLGAARKLGADNTLAKPFTGAELLATVEATLKAARR